MRDMRKEVLMIQLPVPQLNYGHKTGNIPFGPACLRQHAAGLVDLRVDLMEQATASYSGDAAIVDAVSARRPDIIGFTLYAWNIKRSLYLAKRLKEAYGPRIVLGGPEVTPDNPLIRSVCADARVFGEGEAPFAELLRNPEAWIQSEARETAGCDFHVSPSPYVGGFLDAGIENTMLLETMRGCPYACAYCYYGKSRQRLEFKADRLVLEGIAWAVRQGVKEVYFLDPSLNARPRLKELLGGIARINPGGLDGRVALISEIRAESVDAELADLLVGAGFTWFEIGLQSTNPRALELMRRKLDAKRFLEGVQALKARGIITAIDVIVGLPGDDPAGFGRTLDFMVDHGLQDDVQVFPLLVLPGTDFRRRCRDLGLTYATEPPYSVVSTPTFSQADLQQALAYAESRLDVALYPAPDLDLAWRCAGVEEIEEAPDALVQIGGRDMIHRLVVRKGRSPADLAAAATRLSHPYQVWIPPDNLEALIAQTLSIVTAANPYTPLEMVFCRPATLPDTEALLRWDRLARPHYLDGALRPMYARPGNRAIVFTVLTQERQWGRRGFGGPMRRLVYEWRMPALPDAGTFKELEHDGFDGVLIDVPLDDAVVHAFQDELSPAAGDYVLISFARPRFQKRWMLKTTGENYCLDLLPPYVDRLGA